MSNRIVTLDSSWNICIPSRCSTVIETAATELKRYLEIEKRIVIEIKKALEVKPANKTISVYTNRAGGPSLEGLDEADSFRIEIKRHNMLICGSDDRGTLDGVYHLENLLSFEDGASLESMEMTRTPIFKYRFASGGPPDSISDDQLSELSRRGVNNLHIWQWCYMESLTPSEMFPWDGRWIKWDKEKVTRINDIFDRAQRYGMDCWIYVRGTQPFRASYDSFLAEWLDPGQKVFSKFPDVKGSNRGMSPESFNYLQWTRWSTPTCWSSENYKRFIKETCQNLFRSIPNLKGIIVEPMDQTLWCDDSCDACRGKSLASRIVDYIRNLQDAARSVRKDAQVALFHWAFPYHDRSERDLLIGNVPKDVLIVNDFNDGRKQVIDGEFVSYGEHYDVSTVPIPGEVFKRDAALCVEEGVEYMIYQSFGGGMEVYGSFAPYNDIQIAGRLKEHGGSGIFCEGGPGRGINAEMYYWTSWEREPEIYEVLRKIAVRDYGGKAAPKMLEAWRQVCESANKVPDLHYFIHYMVIEAPSLSLYPAENLKYFLHSRRARHPMESYFYAERFLANGSQYFDKVLRFYERAAQGLEEGLKTIIEASYLVDVEKSRKLCDNNINNLEAACCRIWSTLHYLKFIKVLQTSEQWKRELMMDLMRDEIDNTKRLIACIRRDETIGATGWWGRDLDPWELGKKITEMDLDLKKLEKGPYTRPQLK